MKPNRVRNEYILAYRRMIYSVLRILIETLGWIWISKKRMRISNTGNMDFGPIYKFELFRTKNWQKNKRKDISANHTRKIGEIILLCYIKLNEFLSKIPRKVLLVVNLVLRGMQPGVLLSSSMQGAMVLRGIQPGVLLLSSMLEPMVL